MNVHGADLPISDLTAYLSAELDAEVADLSVLDGALNLMVAVSTGETENAYVLRCPSEMRDTELFVDPEREYGVLERLVDTPVPAPEPVLYCDDESLLGDEFFVTTHLDGETVPVGSRLPERLRNEAARGRIGERFVDALADIHSLDVAPFENVCDRQTPLDHVERDVARLDRATDVTGRGVPELWHAADWLHEHVPEDPELRLVHGDYKSGNVFFAGDDRPELTGVFDWETAMLGDPRTELGYALFYWRDDGDPTPDVEAVVPDDAPAPEIEDLREVNEHGFCPFTNRPGSPGRRELVARWEARTGLSFDNDRFYRAQGAFGLATVWEDIYAHDVAAGDADPADVALLDYTEAVVSSIVDGEFTL